LQQAINAEQSRQGAITSQAQSLVSSGAGTNDINAYYATVHPNDQSLVSDTLGVTANNINTYGLSPQSASWYQLQPNETIANYNARIAAANPNLPAPGTTSSTGVTNNAAPQISPIPTVINAPVNTTGAAPTLPSATAPTIVSQYINGIAASLVTAQQQLTQANNQQIQNYQTQIDALTKQQQDNQSLASMGMAQEGNVVAQETAAKQAALQQEQQQYNDAYTANQNIIAQMTTLATNGQQIINGLSAQTGLSAVLSPRITQTMADITGQMGLLKSVYDATNSQIGAAQNQLKSATDAITSLYGDQITYYQNIVSFYSTQANSDTSQITALSKDQQTYIQAQITQLQAQVTNVQNTAKLVSDAMVNPTTAQAFALSGVSLNDTPQQIAQKLGQYQYSQEISATSQKMAQAGYSTTPVPGVAPVQSVDSQGVTTNWYATTKPGTSSASTAITEAGGRRLLVDKTTGSVITDLGPATSGTSATPGGIVFSQAQKTALQGTGMAASDINALQSALNTYGAQSVLDNGQGMSDATKAWIENTYNVSPTPAPSDSGSSSGNIFTNALNKLMGK
jgi:hypothetical protein